MKFPIATKLNLTLFLLLVSGNCFLLFAMPFLLNKSMWYSLLALPILLTSNTYWALIHEGIHYSLHPKKNTNDILSRIASVIFGTAFNVVRSGHLLHHKMNRSQHDRFEVFDPNKNRWLTKSIYYYWFLTGGLYQIEVLLPFLSFMPKGFIIDKLNQTAKTKSDPVTVEYFIQQLNKPKVLPSIRLDALINILIFTISFVLYGKLWWFLLGCLLVRGFLISMADNLPHYNTPIDDRRFAYNLRAPSWLKMLLLNFNFHRVHHHYPNIPWHLLPTTFRQKDNKARYTYAEQWLNQFKGLIQIQDIEKLKV